MLVAGAGSHVSGSFLDLCGSTMHPMQNTLHGMGFWGGEYRAKGLRVVKHHKNKLE
jgi:hypothetical protein